MPVDSYNVQALFVEPYFRANIASAITPAQIEFVQSLPMINNIDNLISETMQLFEEPQMKSIKDAVQDVLDSVPKPARSTKPGMEGALDNLGNTADYLQKQMEAVSSDPDLDPASKTAKLSNLQFQQQSAMNMLTQLSQMMQNTIKLWSDIAMNSVRNIK